MSDPPRLPWLYYLGIAAQKQRSDGPATYGDDIAGLLLDRRLVMARARHVTSFISGMVALLLNQMLFPGSIVLSTVPPDTLRLFELLLVAAVPALAAGRRFVLIFRSSRDGASAAAFHRCCEVGSFRTHLTLLRSVKGLR